jgi:hypothetical protein
MIEAFLSGVRKAASRPWVLIGVWLASVLVALPAAWVVANALDDSFGSSLVAETMREGFDMSWYGEFQADVSGATGTFSPTQTGVGAFLINLEGWATGAVFENFHALLGLGIAWALVWALLLGGVLTRYLPASGVTARAGFFEAGGRYFARFVRLALLAAPLYWMIYRLYRASQEWLADWTRDITRETTVLTYSLTAIVLIAFLLVLVRTCFDYAKIATVVEARRSMFFAACRGIGFVLTHPIRTVGLYLIVALVSLLLLLFYGAIAPGSQASTALTIWAGFAVGQAFLLTRLFLRLSLLAGELALFRKFT